MTTVLMSEGTDPRYRWRNYIIVKDETTVIVEMVPAIMGWNVRGITTQGVGTEQGEDAWPKMSERDIVAWKLHNHPEIYSVLGTDQATQVIDLAKSKGARCE